MDCRHTIRTLEERVSFLAMERAAALEALEVAHDIGSFTASLTGLESLEDILRESAAKIRSLQPFGPLAFFLVDEEDMSLVPAYSEPREKLPFLEKEKEPLIEDRTIAWTLRRKKPVIVSASDGSGRFFLHALASPSKVLGIFMGLIEEDGQEKLNPSYHNYLSIVLTTTAGVIGTTLLLRKIHTLNLSLQEKIHFLEKSREELALYQNNLEKEVAARTNELARTNEELRREIAERKRMEAEIRYHAWHDALTKLPNRELFHTRLLAAITTNSAVAVFFMDLDGFKNVNDTLGHDSGDLLLKEAALRLSEEMGSQDTVARMGGDEFTVVLASPSSRDEVGKSAESILKRISEPFLLGETPVNVTASIGISLYPDDGESVQELMKCADMAMYTAKENGKNRYCFWNKGKTHSKQQVPKI